MMCLHLASSLCRSSKRHRSTSMSLEASLQLALLKCHGGPSVVLALCKDCIPHDAAIKLRVPGSQPGTHRDQVHRMHCITEWQYMRRRALVVLVACRQVVAQLCNDSAAGGSELLRHRSDVSPCGPLVHRVDCVPRYLHTLATSSSSNPPGNVAYQMGLQVLKVLLRQVCAVHSANGCNV